MKMELTEACLDAGVVLYPGGGAMDGVRGDHTLIAPRINITKSEVYELFIALEKGIQTVCDCL